MLILNLTFHIVETCLVFFATSGFYSPGFLLVGIYISRYENAELSKLLNGRYRKDVMFLGIDIDELLEIRYPVLNVTVPLQLLVTAILNETKQLLVTLKNS
jgi:hypothetical protein